MKPAEAICLAILVFVIIAAVGFLYTANIEVGKAVERQQQTECTKDTHCITGRCQQGKCVEQMLTDTTNPYQ